MRAEEAFYNAYLEELEKTGLLAETAAAMSTPEMVTAASTAALALMTGYGKSYKLAKRLAERGKAKIADIKLKLKKLKAARKKQGIQTGVAPQIGTVATELGKGVVSAPKVVSEDIASVT
jgi:hypothetical protein